MKPELDTPYVHFAIREGILIATFKKDVDINLSNAREIVNSRIIFTKNKKIAVMIFNQGVASMQRDAMKFMASKEGTRQLLAAAIMMRSPFEMIFNRLFIMANKPDIAVKTFISEEKAMHWLKEFID